MFFLVQFTEFKYNNNILNNYSFIIACATIGVLGVLSYVSIGFIDIYDLFGLNKERNEEKDAEKEKEKGSRACPKVLLTIIFGLLAIAPLVAGFVFADQTATKTGYISLKSYNDTHVNIQLITANKLRNSANETHTSIKEKGIVMCNTNSTHLKENICGEGIDRKANILVIDFERDKECEKLINNEADKEDSNCLKYSSIIFLESQDYRSSSPKQNKIKGVPVLTVHTRDARIIREAFQESSNIKMDILYDSLGKMMENIKGDSDLKKRGCDNLANPRDQNGNNWETETIALEEKDANAGHLYLGEDSNVKVKSKLDIKCTVYGRRCTALAAWEKEPANQDLMKHFEVECNEIKMSYFYVRKQIDVFKDSAGFHDREHKCFKNDTATLIESKREQGYDRNSDCHLSLRTNCKWGKWVTSKIDDSLQEGREQCTGVVTPKGRMSFRFCRPGRDDNGNKCLFIEVKTLYWNQGSNACDKPNENYFSERDQESEFVDCSEFTVL
jgi:hypothetical protein